MKGRSARVAGVIEGRVHHPRGPAPPARLKLRPQGGRMGICPGPYLASTDASMSWSRLRRKVLHETFLPGRRIAEARPGLRAAPKFSVAVARPRQAQCRRAAYGIRQFYQSRRFKQCFFHPWVRFQFQPCLQDRQIFRFLRGPEL